MLVGFKLIFIIVACILVYFERASKWSILMVEFYAFLFLLESILWTPVQLFLMDIQPSKHIKIDNLILSLLLSWTEPFASLSFIIVCWCNSFLQIICDTKSYTIIHVGMQHWILCVLNICLMQTWILYKYVTHIHVGM